MDSQLLQPSPANAAVGTAAVVGGVSQRVRGRGRGDGRAGDIGISYTRYDNS